MFIAKLFSSNNFVFSIVLKKIATINLFNKENKKNIYLCATKPSPS